MSKAIEKARELRKNAGYLDSGLEKDKHFDSACIYYEKAYTDLEQKYNSLLKQVETEMSNLYVSPPTGNNADLWDLIKTIKTHVGNMNEILNKNKLVKGK